MSSPAAPEFDLGQLIARVHESGVALQLGTVEICHLITLKARLEASGETALSEEALLDTIVEVHAFLDPTADNPRARASTDLRHLREQQLLTRIDGAGLTQAGRFSLSRLGAAIADFFGQDDTLDAESLVVLTRSLKAQLETSRENASGAASDEAWRLGVVAPLEVTARDLVAGIERRQRGLDAAQARIRQRIAHLLRDDWFSAIEACEALLDETADTLAELNAVLLRETSELHGVLQDIEQLARATAPQRAEVIAAAQRLGEEVDRVGTWGASRQRAWSDYYQYVQRFLRDVVRLDPGRALSQRLRDHLRVYLDRPYRFTVAVSQQVPLLRTPELPADRAPLTRPAGQGEVPIEDVSGEDAQVVLADKVKALLAERPESLAVVLEAIVAALPETERYRDVGRMTALVAQHARLAPDDHAARRPFVPVGAGIEVEDWALSWERQRARKKRS